MRANIRQCPECGAAGDFAPIRPCPRCGYTPTKTRGIHAVPYRSDYNAPVAVDTYVRSYHLSAVAACADTATHLTELLRDTTQDDSPSEDPDDLRYLLAALVARIQELDVEQLARAKEEV